MLIFLVFEIYHYYLFTFSQMYDWALRTKEGKLYQRIISFYRLTEHLADKLKNLFCSFAAPYITGSCAQLLNQLKLPDCAKSGVSNDVAHAIVFSVLITLSKCFLYDINGAFLSRERMQSLMKPIINQVRVLLSSRE